MGPGSALYKIYAPFGRAHMQSNISDAFHGYSTGTSWDMIYDYLMPLLLNFMTSFLQLWQSPSSPSFPFYSYSTELVCCLVDDKYYLRWRNLFRIWNGGLGPPLATIPYRSRLALALDIALRLLVLTGTLSWQLAFPNL